MCVFHGDEEKPSCTFFAEEIKIGNTQFKSNGMVEITESHIQFRVANSPIQVKIHGDVIQAVGFNRWSRRGDILLLIRPDVVKEVLDSLGVHRSHVNQIVMAYCGLMADERVIFTVNDISRDVRNAIVKLNENIRILLDCTEAPSEQSNENRDRDSPSTSSERHHHSAIREEIPSTAMESVATFEESENDREEIVLVSDASTSNEIPTNGHQNIETDQMDNRKISICAQDLDSLRPKTYLNDNIVNSYLIHVLAEKQKQNETKIRLLDNFFLKTLSRGINMKQSYSIATGKFGFDIELCNEIARKKERLIQKNKIFDADFLVLPICHEEHWFLIIVCHLPNVLHNEMNCKILIFDSIHHEEDYYQGHLNGLLHSIVGSYMLAGKRVDGDVARLAETLFKNIEVLEIPRQTNTTDCGLYLIEYFERFFDDPHANRDWSKLIDKKVMRYKRQQVKNTLETLME